MPRTEAEKRARLKYTKEKVSRYEVRFYPSDADILAFVKSKDNQQGYIKDLIRADMSRNQDTQES